MSLVIKFYFTSSMLYMFRTLIHPSSGACDFSIVRITTLVVCSCFDVCWNFGLAELGWYLFSRLKHNCSVHVECGGWGLTPSPHTPHEQTSLLQPSTRIPPQLSYAETPTHIETRTHYQCGDTIEKSQAPDDGCINVRNM